MNLHATRKLIESFRAKVMKLTPKQKASAYMRSLVRLTRNADTDRAEIREAKQQLASK